MVPKTAAEVDPQTLMGHDKITVYTPKNDKTWYKTLQNHGPL
jgi:hypothetical protein